MNEIAKVRLFYCFTVLRFFVFHILYPLMNSLSSVLGQCDNCFGYLCTEEKFFLNDVRFAFLQTDHRLLFY